MNSGGYHSPAPAVTEEKPCAALEDAATVADLPQGQPSRQGDLLGLSVLTPAYSQADHEIYVREIQHALDGNDVRNIALSGNYGVGKSSILRQVVAQNAGNIVEISLSALSPAVPQSGTTGDAFSTTNQIQQEIVKQLLYREKPSKTPGSRFRRIQRFQRSREAMGALVAGFVISLGFLLVDWSQKIGSGLGIMSWGPLLHLAIFATAAALTYLVRSLAYGRLSIKQLSAGPATVTLDEQSRSYFDQYLDEIFYFFETSGLNVVVFEDIDRFDDHRIFETLRALNTLLNAPSGGRPIRFIYAMKDSIFERLGEITTDEKSAPKDPESARSHSESQRANRTKFFDLVIPVVPFITHHNAKNVVSGLMSGHDFSVSSDLIDLVSRHIPDMRFLKNARNEFLVFRNRIRSGAGSELRITDTELFAMMLYKGTHLADFENIRLGDSALDKLYRTARELVSDGMRAIGEESAAATKQISAIDSISRRSEALGQALRSHAKRVARAASLPEDDIRFVAHDGFVPADDIEKPAFWQSFFDQPDGPDIEAYIYIGRSHQNTLKFSRSDLDASIGPFTVDDWKDSDRQAISAQLARLASAARFLRGADVQDLIKRQDIAPYLATGGLTVASFVRDVLPSVLAYELVRDGHINRNFALCTAIFHGTRVTSAATNFLMHHVQRGKPDIYFQLSADDIESVIREAGKSLLSDPALYNICVLDHLLGDQSNLENARRMIGALVSMGELEANFLAAYLSNGTQQIALARELSPLYRDVFSYLVSSSQIDDALRAELVGAALTSLNDGIDYKTDAAVRQYLSTAYSSIPSLTGGSVGANEARRIAWLFSKAQARVEFLDTLSVELIEAFTARSLYLINHQNLVTANGGGADISLDALEAANPSVFKYVLENLPIYLMQLQLGEYSVTSAASFPRMLLAAGNWDEKVVRHLVRSASPNCIVDDLKLAPASCFPVLAGELRCPATLVNVLTYLDHYEAVDQSLAHLLTHFGSIFVPPESEWEDTSRAALAILRAKDVLPPELRAEIVSKMDVRLSVADVPIENGVLISLLVRDEVVEDDESLYERLSEADWPTRECFIAQSVRFSEYMSAELLNQDLYNLVRSGLVPQEVKIAIVTRAEEFAETSSVEGLNALGHFAAANSAVLPLNVVLRLADVLRPPETFVKLMEPHLSVMTSAQMVEALGRLGKPYSDLSAAGAKKPLVANTPPVVALLGRLYQLKIVSSWTEVRDGFRVHKKRG